MNSDPTCYFNETEIIDSITFFFQAETFSCLKTAESIYNAPFVNLHTI